MKKKKYQRTARGIAVGCLPPPTGFGAPEKFKEFRPQQEEALVLLHESDKRFDFLQMPTGSGKSLTNFLYALAAGRRTLILTQDKGLEDLYANDFGEAGLVDVRGAGNYVCRALQRGGQYEYLRPKSGPASRGMCDTAPCKSGLYCKFKENYGECEWFDKLTDVRGSRVVVTNYANWLARAKARVHKSADGEIDDDEHFGRFDVLIMDECHAAAEQTSKALTVELKLWELEIFFGSSYPHPPTIRNRAVAKLLGRGGVEGEAVSLSGWSGWLGSLHRLQVRSLEGALGELRNARDSGGLHSELTADIKFLRRLGSDLELLTRISEKDFEKWVVDIITLGRDRQMVTFQPEWPGEYAEKYLFRGVKRVVGMSATIHPYMIEKLGLDRKDYNFYEFDSDFPVENRPVYVWPVAYMKWDMADSEKRRVVHATDQILKMFPKDKGIVHTVSYDRANYYHRHTTESRVLQSSRGSVAEEVSRFKDTVLPSVLVSPAVSTGYDFAEDAARFQVLQKVPFADKRSAIQKRRCESDPRYPHAQAMNYIVQMAGRIVRSATDYGITIITDGVFWDWYESNGKQYAPKWFREAVRRAGRLSEVKRVVKVNRRLTE